jgi:hypothetical protein
MDLPGKVTLTKGGYYAHRMCEDCSHRGIETVIRGGLGIVPTGTGDCANQVAGVYPMCCVDCTHQCLGTDSTFVVKSVHTRRGNKPTLEWVLYTAEVGNLLTCGRGIYPLGRCVISSEESTDRIIPMMFAYRSRRGRGGWVGICYV